MNHLIVKLIKETSASVGLDVHEIEYNDSEIGSVLINSGVQTDTIDSDSDDEAVKSKNLVQYTTYKLEKRKRKLEREIDTQKEKLKTFSTKNKRRQNVNKEVKYYLDITIYINRLSSFNQLKINSELFIFYC